MRNGYRAAMAGVQRATTAVLLVCGLLGSGCAGDEANRSQAAQGNTQSAPATAPPSPVIDQDFPDPDVLQVDGVYHAYATQRSDGSSNVQHATSPDLERWRVDQGDPLPQLPVWATSGRTWAPDVSAVGERFVMYLTAWDADTNLQCIGVATSSSPAGPFTPVGAEPLVCPAARGGAIDAASFVGPGGGRYLLWKNDGNCCGKPTWIHLQRLSDDGLRTVGAPRRLVRADRPWEGPLVEAPTLVRRGGKFVLLYSANTYSDGSYATGYAVAGRLRGPYRKAGRPLLTTEATGVTGPGGQDVIEGSDGSTYIAFHGWDGALVYRAMYVRKLSWRGSVPGVE